MGFRRFSLASSGRFVAQDSVQGYRLHISERVLPSVLPRARALAVETGAIMDPIALSILNSLARIYTFFCVGLDCRDWPRRCCISIDRSRAIVDRNRSSGSFVSVRVGCPKDS
jgi:hypothetical protein